MGRVLGAGTKVALLLTESGGERNPYNLKQIPRRGRQAVAHGTQ